MKTHVSKWIFNENFILFSPQIRDNAKNYSVVIAVILSFTQQDAAIAATSQFNAYIELKNQEGYSAPVQLRNTGEIKISLFERFTEPAIKVIMLAQEESRRLGHDYVGTEHILLGLISEGNGVAAKVLSSNSVNLNNARSEVEKITGRGAGRISVEIPFTPGAKKLLEQSLVESEKLSNNSIDTEHLLLGLIEQKEDIGARVLKNLRVDLPKIRPQVIQQLNQAPKKSS
jgi:Clp amino terminal domain, pathogenicity island component